MFLAVYCPHSSRVELFELALTQSCKVVKCTDFLLVFGGDISGLFLLLRCVAGDGVSPEIHWIRLHAVNAGFV
eukprot:4202368-Amphidinium_carterae.1